MAKKRKASLDRLEAPRIVATAERLQRRVHERFPDSGLSRVAEGLLEVARGAEATCDEISRPNVFLRAVIALILLLLGALAVAAFVRLDPDPLTRPSVMDVLALIESGINDLVFGGIVVVFLISLEGRWKRRRALRALSELRAIAHVIDMHQLTKAPERVHAAADTPSSPTRDLDAAGLSRYLEYCSEMLSLCGKVAALYLQELTDSHVLGAVEEIESLTTGLSRKIWQKLDILHR